MSIRFECEQVIVLGVRNYIEVLVNNSFPPASEEPMFDRFHPRYLVPNGVPAANLILALTAIVEARRGRPEAAAWLIVWCALLDRVDGVVARWLGASSEFGIQFDTLSDLLAFCVAPGLLVYLLLPADVVAASPILLLTCSVFMLSNLWLPKSLEDQGRIPLPLFVFGATAIYGLGLARAFPVALLAGAIAYPALGFIVGASNRPGRIIACSKTSTSELLTSGDHDVVNHCRGPQMSI